MDHHRRTDSAEICEASFCHSQSVSSAEVKIDIMPHHCLKYSEPFDSSSLFSTYMCIQLVQSTPFSTFYSISQLLEMENMVAASKHRTPQSIEMNDGFPDSTQHFGSVYL